MGHSWDCPVVERLIRRVKPSKRMLGDKAYDSAELREDLHERGTKPVIDASNAIKELSESPRCVVPCASPTSACEKAVDSSNV